jgi:hypothetical protein
MGWMQELAGSTPLKGQVVVTRAGGGSKTYVNAATAEDDCGDLKGKLRFFRGAFFEQGGMPRKAVASAPAPVAPAPSSSSSEGESKVSALKKRSSRSSRSSDDD